MQSPPKFAVGVLHVLSNSLQTLHREVLGAEAREVAPTPMSGFMPAEYCTPCSSIGFEYHALSTWHPALGGRTMEPKRDASSAGVTTSLYPANQHTLSAMIVRNSSSHPHGGWETHVVCGPDVLPHTTCRMWRQGQVYPNPVHVCRHRHNPRLRRSRKPEHYDKIHPQLPALH